MISVGEDIFMENCNSNDTWAQMTYEEKQHQLFLKQKGILDEFLAHEAITRAQHDKSLHDLIEKMGESK